MLEMINDKRPVSQEDVLSIQKILAENCKEKSTTIVTHLPIEFKEIIRNNTKRNQEILFIFVGNDERPASLEDAKDVKILFDQVFLDPNLIVVTHYAIKFITIKKTMLDNINVVNYC